MGVLGDPTLWATVVSQNPRGRGQVGIKQQDRSVAQKSLKQNGTSQKQKKQSLKRPPKWSPQEHSPPKKDFRHGKWKGRTRPHPKVANSPFGNRRNPLRDVQPPLPQFYPTFLSPFPQMANPYYQTSPSLPNLPPHPLLWRELLRSAFNLYPMNLR